MTRNTTFVSMRRPAFAALILTLGLAAAMPASADPVCKAVHGRVEIVAHEPTCGSAIALCASAILHGTIKANSDFIGTSSVPTIDTATTGVVVLTGDNVFHTTDGDFFTKDAIVLNTTGDGEFTEIDTITGGTGEYAGASGYLIASGTFSQGVGVGTYVGKVCWQ
jgi:hypothetical protein